MSEKGHCQMEIVIPELWKRNKSKIGEDKGKSNNQHNRAAQSQMLQSHR